MRGAVGVADRERYRALVEHSADVIFIHRRHRRPSPTRTGPPSARLGMRTDALVGRNALDLVHPDDRSRAVEALTARSRPGPGAQDPFFARVRHADGHWLPVELVGNNLMDDDARRAASSSRCATSRTGTGSTGSWPRPRRATAASSRPPKKASGPSTARIEDDVREPADGRDARRDARRHDRALGLRVHGRRSRRPWPGRSCAKAAGDPVAQRHEIKFRHADGHDVWTRCSAAPILGRRRRDSTAWSRSSPTSPSSARSRSSSATTRRGSRRCSRCRPTSWRSSSRTGTGTPAPPAPASSATRSGWDPEGGMLSLVHPDDIEIAGIALERGPGRHPGQARADPGPAPPHRRSLPLVRLHRREPDRQPDRARPDHHRPRRHRPEGRRGRARSRRRRASGPRSSAHRSASR